MGFLLIKILFLLGLAAASGGLLAYWWFRRHYEDVTLDYARTREEWHSWRRGFEERLAARPAVDLEPLAQQVAAVQAAVADIPPPEPPDLAPLQTRLDELARRISELRIPDLTATDQRLTGIEHALFPLQTRLDGLESAVRALRVPQPEILEVDPLLERLGALEVAAENDGAAAPKVAVREGSKNLLSHAAHGEPDDLTQIKGVAKVLEHTLHKVGVYYFWQIAEWSPDDVRHVESQLDSFQGRIERDEWVSQASELASLPTATPRPEEH
jgi:predicted flap endonuclease-1-like 5' DNA nuclease